MRFLFLILFILIFSVFSGGCKSYKISTTETPLPEKPSEISYTEETGEYITRASILMEDKKMEEAIQILELIKPQEILFKNRRDFLLALCYLQDGEYKKTIDLMENMEYLPEYRDFFIYMAFMKLDEDKALYELDQIASKYPESPVLSEAFYRAGNLYFYRKNYSNAIKYYEKALMGKKRFNFFPEVYYRLARIFVKQRDWNRAIKYYSKIIYLYPFHSLAFEARKMVIYIEKNKHTSPYKPDSEELATAGEEYRKRFKFKEALEYYRKYTELYPVDALSSGGYYKRALCEYAAGSPAKGEELLKITSLSGGNYSYEAQYDLARGSIQEMKKFARKYRGTSIGSRAQYMAGYYLECNGNISEAIKEYRLMARLFPKGSWGDAAYWNLGRIYYRQKLYANARDAFLRATAIYPYNEWSGQCMYWQAKCYEKLDKPEEGEKIYKEVVARYDHTYYSYRARARLLLRGYDEYLLNNEEPPFFREGLRRTFEGQGDKNYKNFIELVQLGLFDYAENELILAEFPTEKEKLFSYGLLLAGQGRYFESIEHINTEYDKVIAQGRVKDLPKGITCANYPLPYWEYIYENATMNGLDPYLVSALIREESHYDESIYSCVGACGLMQIMPDTGRYISDQIGIKFEPFMLLKPETNIMMGTFYLSEIQKNADNNVVLALAGYNGGPGNAEYWWATNYKGDIDEFIETIPYSETRNYVKRVLRSYWEYKRFYDREQPDYLSVYDCEE
ncbi:MAG TPA: tetratricopeptide repeat protein [Candidatus Eremiobacteraeota bacterium]|nr:tetratricopeptide repeat protein [Candidatus Eremiobacteraeota bacterium]